MWKMSYREYLELPGNKEEIKQVKQRKKAQAGRVLAMQGEQVETGITKILGDIPGFEVKVMPPQFDIGFGADVQVSYMEDGKNYSMFVDITSSTSKSEVSYLMPSGQLTDDIADAFCYRTEYFSVRFGLKKKHVSRFLYEKPVVVLLIENYTPTTGLGLHHIQVMGNLMQNLNSLLMKQGYGARASQKVYPNPKKFPNEYQAYKTAAY